MTVRRLLVPVMVIACLATLAVAQFLPPGALAASEPADTTETTTEASAASPQRTPPAATAVESDGEVKELGEIDLIKVFKGEKALTPEQVFQLGYWISFVKDIVFGLLAFIPRVFVALFLFTVFWLIYRTVRRVLIGGMAKAGVDSSIRDMLGSLLKWSILGFGLVIAGNQIGIQIAALLTGVSIIGLAIGFAAQETLANFIAGIVIFWDRPFKVGDWIEVDGVFAQVQRVTFRSTRIVNGDGEVVIFPNTYMLDNKVINHTTNPKNRVTVSIGIAYKESISAAREVLLGLVQGDERICTDPEPVVVVDSCGDSSVNLLLRFWITDESIEFKIRFEYLERAKNALDAAGIQIPYPHLQLFVEQTAAISALGPKPFDGAGHLAA